MLEHVRGHGTAKDIGSGEELEVKNRIGCFEVCEGDRKGKIIKKKCMLGRSKRR